MRAVIFCGIQGVGKSTLYRGRFFDTHVRVSLDLLRTRHRERALVEWCLAAGQPFVVDNTNVTAAERAVYVAAARGAGFAVSGYYFRSSVAEAKARNAGRVGRARVPEVGLLGTAGRLERPTLAEGFDELFYVRIDPAGGFAVEPWREEEEP